MAWNLVKGAHELRAAAGLLARVVPPSGFSTAFVGHVYDPSDQSHVCSLAHGTLDAAKAWCGSLLVPPPTQDNNPGGTPVAVKAAA